MKSMPFLRIHHETQEFCDVFQSYSALPQDKTSSFCMFSLFERCLNLAFHIFRRVLPSCKYARRQHDPNSLALLSKWKITGICSTYSSCNNFFCYTAPWFPGKSQGFSARVSKTSQLGSGCKLDVEVLWLALDSAICASVGKSAKTRGLIHLGHQGLISLELAASRAQ